MPALAFGSHYSVFKERPGTHLFTGVDAGCPKDCSGRKALAGESPSVAGGPGGPFRRVCQIIRRASERQRVRTGRIPTGQRPGSADDVNSTGRRRPGSRTPRQFRAGSRDTDRWHAKNHNPALRMPPRCSGPNWLSALHPSARVRLRRRALPVDLLDLPRVTDLRDRIITSGCCTAVTTP